MERERSSGAFLLFLLGLAAGGGLIYAGMALGLARLERERGPTTTVEESLVRRRPGLDLPRSLRPAPGEAARDEAREALVAELERERALRVELEGELDKVANQVIALRAREEQLRVQALQAELRLRGLGDGGEPMPTEASLAEAEATPEVAQGGEASGAPPGGPEGAIPLEPGPAVPGEEASEEPSLEEELAAFRAAFNQRLAEDGYPEVRLVRFDGFAASELIAPAFLVQDPHRDVGRLLSAERAHLRAYPSLRSLRIELFEGYEQVGRGEPRPFPGGRFELSWADLNYARWKELLKPLGELHELGSTQLGKPDPRFAPLVVQARLNELLALADGPRRFAFRRIDRVVEGPQLGGVEIHQYGTRLAELEVIYEAESATLSLARTGDMLEIVLENGFQRRGLERLPFFEQRARIFVRLPSTKGWDPGQVPLHNPLDAPRKGT